MAFMITVSYVGATGPRPVPAKLTAVEGLVSAILAQAGNVNHLTTPAGMAQL